MTKEDKINRYVSEWYKWLLGEVKRNIAIDGMSEYSDDLLHHVILDLYNLPEHKITQMVDDDKLRWYVLRGCSLQLRSSTSPFYRLHRREKMQSRESYTHNSNYEFQGSFSGKGILEKIDEPYIHDELWDCFQESMNNLGYYHKALLQKHFMEKWSLQKIHKYYGISKKHVINGINEGIEIVRENCKHC